MPTKAYMKEVEVISAVRDDSLSSLFSRREEFRVSLVVPSAYIAELARSWLQSLHSLCSQNGNLINAKGRDRGAPLSLANSEGPIADHEIFFLSGTTSDSSRKTNFTLSLNAKFEEIKANRDYYFSITPHFQTPLNLDINPLALTFASGVTPTAMRGSIQLYKETFFSSMLGSFPKITESTEIEMNGNFCSIIIWAMMPKSAPALPKRNSFGLAARAVSQALPLDLNKIYSDTFRSPK